MTFRALFYVVRGDLGGWCRFAVYLNVGTQLQHKVHRRVLEVALLAPNLVRDLLGVVTVQDLEFRVHN